MADFLREVFEELCEGGEGPNREVAQVRRKLMVDHTVVDNQQLFSNVFS